MTHVKHLLQELKTKKNTLLQKSQFANEHKMKLEMICLMNQFELLNNLYFELELAIERDEKNANKDEKTAND